MSVTMTDRFRKWYAYEKDAHKKVLASLETVPVARHSEEVYQQALDLFGHVIAARWFWLFRFGAAPKPDNLFPEKMDLDVLRRGADEMYSAWDDYFEKLDEADLDREVEYRSTEGARYTNKIEDILKQLSDHSRYHCGQIASRVKACGGTAASTDYVFFLRELTG